MSITMKAQKGAAKPMLWISMASMAMIFAGLTSAYVVRKATGNWTDFALPTQFTISTTLIILSSLFMIVSSVALKKNNIKLASTGIALALVSGLGFGYFQLDAWSYLTEMGIFFTGPSANASGSFLYALTFVHLVHLIGGIIALIVTLTKCVQGKYSAESKLGFELTSIFWHFLGALWLYLFLFLLFIR